MKKRNWDWFFLLRLLILTLIKEVYLFLRNLYGLFIHPFRTIVKILKEPDWSQLVLVLGLPVWGGLGVLGILGSFGVVLFFWPTNEILVNLFFLLIVFCSLLVSVYSFYLGYWLVFYQKTKHLGVKR